MKIVATYGTFDLFHYGHLRLLQRASMLGDKLIVFVSTDEFNLIKNKNSVIPFSQRIEIVSNIKCVDKVYPEYSFNQKIKNIKDYNINLIVMGDDWKTKFDYLPCKIIYLPRTNDISTTEIKKWKLQNI